MLSGRKLALVNLGRATCCENRRFRRPRAKSKEEEEESELELKEMEGGFVIIFIYLNYFCCQYRKVKTNNI